MPDIMSMLQQNPQLLQALGLGGGMGGMSGAPGGIPTPGGALPGALNPLANSVRMGASPDAMLQQQQQPPNPPAMGGGPRSNPGLMPEAIPQTPPQAGTYESGPRMAGDSQNTPTNREPTGENPQRPQPQNAIPSIPRNRFGALLMPQGGQVGGGSSITPNPTGAFNWQNLLSSFLQRRGLQPSAGPTSGMGGAPGGAPGIMGGGGAGPMPY